MATILIGTGNPAKFQRYKTILTQFPQLAVLSLRDVQIQQSVIEDGLTAEANARKKAQTYARLTNLPTLSVDEALTLPGLSLAEQPGLNVRRYLGREMTDEALLDLFVEKIRQLAPADRVAVWMYAICLALPNGPEFCAQVELHKLLTDQPRLPIIPGYPLSSIMLDSLTGKALRDLTAEEEEQHLQPVYEQIGQLVHRVGL